jgi:hypothetical protein
VTQPWALAGVKSLCFPPTSAFFIPRELSFLAKPDFEED